MKKLALLLFCALACAAAAADERPASLERAYEEVVTARAALEQAEALRDRGVEPLPGERLGIVDGGRSRLSPEYWERQKRLEEQVEAARRRLYDAQRRWNDVR